jgi:hypothetical protein
MEIPEYQIGENRGKAPRKSKRKANGKDIKRGSGCGPD